MKEGDAVTARGEGKAPQPAFSSSFELNSCATICATVDVESGLHLCYLFEVQLIVKESCDCRGGLVTSARLKYLLRD